jgi:putrescine transport system substrate-binding protein
MTQPEAMEAKMLAGSTGFDVVIQAGSTLERFTEAKVYQPLDRSKLTNWGNLDPVSLKTVEAGTPEQIWRSPTCGAPWA